MFSTNLFPSTSHISRKMCRIYMRCPFSHSMRVWQCLSVKSVTHCQLTWGLKECFLRLYHIFLRDNSQISRAKTEIYLTQNAPFYFTIFRYIWSSVTISCTSRLWNSQFSASLTCTILQTLNATQSPSF